MCRHTEEGAFCVGWHKNMASAKRIAQCQNNGVVSSWSKKKKRIYTSGHGTDTCFDALAFCFLLFSVNAVASSLRFLPNPLFASSLLKIVEVHHLLLALGMVPSGRFHLAVWGTHRSSPPPSFWGHHPGTSCRWCGDSGNNTKSFHPI